MPERIYTYIWRRTHISGTDGSMCVARDPPTVYYDALVLNATADTQGLVPVLLLGCALRARARPLTSLLVHTHTERERENRDDHTPHEDTSRHNT